MPDLGNRPWLVRIILKLPAVAYVAGLAVALGILMAAVAQLDTDEPSKWDWLWWICAAGGALVVLVTFICAVVHVYYTVARPPLDRRQAKRAGQELRRLLLEEYGVSPAEEIRVPTHAQIPG